MLFKKRKRMIDVRELQRRGVVRIPKEDVMIPTDSNGFVEIGSPKSSTTQSQGSGSSNADFFGFIGNSSASETAQGTDGYGKREVDGKVVNLDNKIYKLEQRIELLEKKLNVGKPADSNVGIMGW